MERKKLMRYGGIVFGILLVLILIEKGIEVVPKVSKTIQDKKEEKKAQESYLHSELYYQDELIGSIVESLGELLLNKRYQTLYSVIDKDYLDYQFHNDRDAFKEYIDKITDGLEYIELADYEAIGDIYYATIMFVREDSSYTHDWVFMVHEGEESVSYELIPENLAWIAKGDGSGFNDEMKIRFDVLYVTVVEQKMTYLLECKNEGDKEIHFDLDTILLRDNKGRIFPEREITNTDTEITLKPGETDRILTVFGGDEIRENQKIGMQIALKLDGREEIVNCEVSLRDGN